MKKVQRVWGVMLIFGYMMSMIPQVSFSQEEGYPIQLASGETIRITRSQLEAILQSSGIGFSEIEPVLRPGEIAIPIPKELGGGYIVGTPESIANALGSIGIPVAPSALIGVPPLVPPLGIAGIVGGAIGAVIYVLVPRPERVERPPVARHH